MQKQALKKEEEMLPCGFLSLRFVVEQQVQITEFRPGLAYTGVMPGAVVNAHVWVAQATVCVCVWTPPHACGLHRHGAMLDRGV